MRDLLCFFICFCSFFLWFCRLFLLCDRYVLFCSTFCKVCGGVRGEVFLLRSEVGCLCSVTGRCRLGGFCGFLIWVDDATTGGRAGVSMGWFYLFCRRMSCVVFVFDFGCIIHATRESARHFSVFFYFGSRVFFFGVSLEYCMC